MKKRFLILFSFIFLALIPNNVFADVSGTYIIDRYTLTNYNSEDLTDYYTTNTANLSYISNTNSTFYTFYNMGFSGRYTYNNITTYQPDFINVFYSNGNMSLCSENCDIDISFNFAIRASVYNGSPGTNNATTYAKASAYLQHTAGAFTTLGGVTLYGKDINDNDKYFYCTGTYVISTAGQDNPYYRFIATCPTSNFKYISSIRFMTAFTGGTGLDHTYNGSYNFFITAMNYNIRDYTGTQDGIGGSGSGPEDPDPDDPMTDDNIDLQFQNGTLNDINGQLASNNVISDLLLLPVRMYQAILNSLGSNSCQAFNLGSLYGTNLVLPCIQVQNYVGSTLWTTIDLIFCGIFILAIRKKFVDIFNNMTSLKNRGNELE